MNSDYQQSTKINREKLRLEVMRVVEANPEKSQREIARELGVSLGGVNYAMKALVERGLVKAKNFGRSDNKLGYVYVLTPQGIKQKSELAASFLSRKLEEYELLRQEIEVLRREIVDEEEAGS
ncbi:MarR family EPS-associated transcriptional regulator [Candidatus Paraluminiphilus aquimaris]|uniref:MarR family EPS-associated transcriptional regulator n=1 Tax=Candidatus Paraluminiphilus aquimaris TaxID=2518994 RepID=A0ABY6Q5Y2_9GAMM|nr:MarR family EPS-associated transcriptional regulator [Candidatus Paraluminiphilus aquimaris]UZP74301.1 MarR family EPS-associated transcriptional regulator [Candidatus Paraluminiphilus aquimaris]